MTVVAIYRHQLFKRSESFIHAQASNIPRHRKVYVGRTCVGEIPPRAEVSVLDDHREMSTLVRMSQVITRDPRRFAELMSDKGVKLIHAHFGVEGVYAERISERLDVPLVTTFHGFDATLNRGALIRSGKASWINYVMNRGRLAQRGALFICVSQFIRERVLALGFPENRTVVHYIGVDTSSPPSPLSRSNSPTVLHVARLVEKKGTGDLIAAFAKVLRTIPDANLVIVGDGPQEAVLRAQVRALNIEQSVAFLGSKPHSAVLDLMASAWVFCLPSITARSGDSEGLAIVLLEAGACGLPVVATRHGGIPEAVEHEKSGLLHEEHDVEGLASSLEHLLRNEKVRLEMGRNARAHIVKNFSLLQQSTALADIYESIR